MLKIVIASCLLSVMSAQSLSHTGSTALASGAYDPLARDSLLRNPLSTAYPSTLAAQSGRYYSDPAYLRSLALTGQTNYLGRPDSDLLSRDYLLRQNYNRFGGQYPGYNTGAYNSGAYNNGAYPYGGYSGGNYYDGQYPGYNRNQRLYSGYNNYNVKNNLGYGVPTASALDGAYDSRYYA